MSLRVIPSLGVGSVLPWLQARARPERPASPPALLALLPGSSDLSFCFLVAVSTGAQNRPARKTSAADNSEPGMVGSLGEPVGSGELGPQGAAGQGGCRNWTVLPGT